MELDEEALAFEWRTMPNAFPEAEKKRLMEMQPDEAWADIGEMRTLTDEVRHSFERICYTAVLCF